MSGDEEGAKVFAKHNIAEMARRGVETLITGCPACFRMWKSEIPELMGKKLNFEVLHSLEFFNRRVEEGKLVLPGSNDVLTYHDPCELSRLGGVVDEPRGLLGRLTSGFVEMPENGVDVRCCGGGGLLQASDNELRLSIVKRRIEQAKSVGAGVITSACPACNLTLKDGVREIGEDIEVLDLVEYMVQRLGLD